MLKSGRATSGVTASETAAGSWDGRRVAALVACAAFAAAVLAYFHDRQWNYYDDGAYLHVADRMIGGEVLHRDVQDVHAGYINFANAASLRFFGNDAVSPRYPLVAMGVANAALAFWLLAGQGLAAAAAASLAVTCLSCVQFMNPTAHWYALSLTMLAAAVMVRPPQGSGGARHVCLGLLVGLVFLFRQLTGVFVGAAVVLHLLLELPQAGRGREAWAGKALVAAVGLVLGWYLLRKIDAVAVLMYGAWPLALLAWGARRLSATNRDVARTVLRLALGAALSLAPLLGYHLANGSVRIWLTDAFAGALALTRLEFIDDQKYWALILKGARWAARPEEWAQVPVGLFWVIALTLPVLHGAALVASLWRGERSGAAGGAAVAPLPLLGAFYFLVALHYQKYMYFFFAAPVMVVGLLALARAWRPAYRRVLLAAAFALPLFALLFIAGLLRGMMPGDQEPLVADHGVPRCDIRLTPGQARFYHEALSLVGRESAPGAAIFAVPVAPELYYLTGRPNPTRFYNTALALRSPEEVEAQLRAFERAPPALVFHAPSSHYNTRASDEVMAWVERAYEPLGSVGKFNVYGHPLRHGCRPGGAQRPSSSLPQGHGL